MEAYERDFHDDSSSFDDILDFDFTTEVQENARKFEYKGEDLFYRHLDEY